MANFERKYTDEQRKDVIRLFYMVELREGETIIDNTDSKIAKELFMSKSAVSDIISVHLDKKFDLINKKTDESIIGGWGVSESVHKKVIERNKELEGLIIDFKLRIRDLKGMVRNTMNLNDALKVEQIEKLYKQGKNGQEVADIIGYSHRNSIYTFYKRVAGISITEFKRTLQ